MWIFTKYRKLLLCERHEGRKVMYMARIGELRTRIEEERVKLNISLEKNEDLQASYQQNVLLDKLIEQYIVEVEKFNKGNNQQNS